MANSYRKCILLFILVLGLPIPVWAESAPNDIVIHAVLFYSPSCTHCQHVIAESVAPLKEKYGERLYVLAVSNGSQAGQELYESAVVRYNIEHNRRGVPTIIIDDVVLVGAIEIPGYLPQLIEEGVLKGGADWPDIPGLDAYLARYGLQESTLHKADLSPLDRFKQDLFGNSLAVIVLVILVFSLVSTVNLIFRSKPETAYSLPEWVVALLIAAGLLVAAYLSYVEMTQSEAICGPVGHCNTVQQSEYAYLFGIMPIGILGAAGYSMLGGILLLSRFAPVELRRLGSYGFWLLLLLGTIFSTYLTFLEPFVIGASCIWCLSSAFIMALLLWSATGDVLNMQNHQGHSESMLGL